MMYVAKFSVMMMFSFANEIFFTCESNVHCIVILLNLTEQKQGTVPSEKNKFF